MSTGNARGKTLRYVVIALVVMALLSAAVFAATLISGGDGQASAPISAPTLETNNTFSIVSDESTVRFSLDEELFGQATHVVGETDQVAGDIAVDFTTPANSEVGVIRINVRTLATDRDMRDRAIRSFILQSADDRYEFAQFTPTAITGLPETITMGTAFTFQITGDLLIRDVTQSATFDVTVTPESDTRLSGHAQATVTRASYGLEIPNAPGVANVSDDVLVEIDFVAVKGAAAAATAEASS
ncbi:MAG: YceI family protein [Anaerolineae bacterium]